MTWQLIAFVVCMVYMMTVLPWLTARLAARRVLRDLGIGPDVAAAIRRQAADPEAEVTFESEQDVFIPAGTRIKTLDNASIPDMRVTRPEPPESPPSGSVAARVRKLRPPI